MRSADCLCQHIRYVRHSLLWRSRVYFCRDSLNQKVQQVLEPAEYRVILCDLAIWIKLNPGIDGHRNENAKSGRVESHYRCRGCDVVICSELSDIVCDWDANKTDVVRVGEKTENIFAVQLVTIKGARNIDTALNLYRVSG